MKQGMKVFMDFPWGCNCRLFMDFGYVEIY